jgi:WD40 repeat protein
LLAFFAATLVTLLVCETRDARAPREAYLGEVAAKIIPAPTKGIRALAMAPAGKALTYCGHRGTVVVTFPEGKVLHELDGDSLFPTFLAFSPDGKWLVGTNPRGLRMWDLGTGKLQLTQKWSREPTAKSSTEEQIALPAISPVGKQLYVAGTDDVFRVVEVESGKELKKVRLAGKLPTSFSASPDGKLLAVATADAFALYRTDTFGEIKRVRLPQDDKTSQRYAVAFHSDSNRLFVMGPSRGEHTAEVQVWDCGKAEFALRCPPPQSEAADPQRSSAVAVGGGRYACLTPTGKTFGIYDLKEGKYLGWARTNSGSVGPLLVSPDGKQIVGGVGSDNLVVIQVEDLLKMIPSGSPAKNP